MNNASDIVIYQSASGEVAIDVKMQDETVWLSLNQMVRLFARDKSVISRHLKNIFLEEELEEDATVATFATVQSEGGKTVTRLIDYYNLDAIISVGYRVNSKQGVQFRRWASNILKEYLLKGYCVNQEKLASDRLLELKQTVDLLSSALINQSLVSDIGADILNIIQSYTKTWGLLLKYDEDQLVIPQNLHKAKAQSITYDNAKSAICALREELIRCKEAGDIFGIERSEGLKSILGNLEQSFDGDFLYPSYEEKAAHLLYFTIKDHPFTDGNKRIGCLLFLLFLKQSGVNLKIINSNGLTALALLVAESNPIQKDLMIKLIINMIADK
jgi:prophage maintenance system killer protein